MLTLRCRRVIGRRPSCKMWLGIQWPFSKVHKMTNCPRFPSSCFCFFQKCQPLKSHKVSSETGQVHEIILCQRTLRHPSLALPFLKDTAHIFRMTPEQGFCVGSDLCCTLIWSRAISGRETRENCHSFNKNFQGRGGIHVMSGLLLVPQIDTLEFGISETKHHIEV